MMRSISVIIEERARRPASIWPGNHVNGLLGGRGKVKRGVNEEECLVQLILWIERNWPCRRRKVRPTIHLEACGRRLQMNNEICKCCRSLLS